MTERWRTSGPSICGAFRHQKTCRLQPQRWLSSWKTGRRMAEAGEHVGLIIRDPDGELRAAIKTALADGKTVLLRGGKRGTDRQTARDGLGAAHPQG